MRYNVTRGTANFEHEGFIHLTSPYDARELRTALLALGIDPYNLRRKGQARLVSDRKNPENRRISIAPTGE